MFMVFVFSRGIFASILPAVSRISIVGCFFSSGLSTTIFRQRPVTSLVIRHVGDEVPVLDRARVLRKDRGR
jgi:hypothetical protein